MGFKRVRSPLFYSPLALGSRFFTLLWNASKAVGGPAFRDENPWAAMAKSGMAMAKQKAPGTPPIKAAPTMAPTTAAAAAAATVAHTAASAAAPAAASAHFGQPVFPQIHQHQYAPPPKAASGLRGSLGF